MKNILGKPDIPSLLLSLSKQAKNEVKINQVLLKTLFSFVFHLVELGSNHLVHCLRCPAVFGNCEVVI